jgi:hypothetical protein
MFLINIPKFVVGMAKFITNDLKGSLSDSSKLLGYSWCWKRTLNNPTFGGNTERNILFFKF